MRETTRRSAGHESFRRLRYWGLATDVLSQRQLKQLETFSTELHLLHTNLRKKSTKILLQNRNVEDNQKHFRSKFRATPISIEPLLKIT